MQYIGVSVVLLLLVLDAGSVLLVSDDSFELLSFFSSVISLLGSCLQTSRCVTVIILSTPSLNQQVLHKVRNDNRSINSHHQLTFRILLLLSEHAPHYTHTYTHVHWGALLWLAIESCSPSQCRFPRPRCRGVRPSTASPHSSPAHPLSECESIKWCRLTSSKHIMNSNN